MKLEGRNAPFIFLLGVNFAITILIGDHFATPAEADKGAVVATAVLFQLQAITASTQAPAALASAEPALDLARQVSGPAGTLTDPDLRAGLVPWPRTLESAELALLKQLCATILPADERSPSAADLACHDFIDEWVSAPYPRQQRDRKIILAGLNWLDQQATEQNQAETFLQLEPAQQAAILDSICTPASTNREAAGFFATAGPCMRRFFYHPSGNG